MIAPGSWLGLLGGGQLGRMFCMAAQSMGYKVAVLDPSAASPAGAVADRHLQAAYLDTFALAQLAELTQGSTTEFENVPASSLAYLATQGRVTPLPESVAIAQDRIREKLFLQQHGFALTPFAIVNDANAARNISADLLPGIVKSARFGYDGKGQHRVATREDVAAAVEQMAGSGCVLEKLVDLALEVSVIVARSDNGTATTWQVAENIHRDGILDVSIVPARIDSDMAAEATSLALAVAQALDYRGVLCVEMFVQTDGKLLINEIAPRPHNSGHYTIDACVTSQFEQQVRVLADLPLGDTRQHEPAVMINLLGDLWFPFPATDDVREPDWQIVLAEPRAKLHLYGKAEPRRGRKMGHVTCLAPKLADAIALAKKIRRGLGIPQGVAF